MHFWRLQQLYTKNKYPVLKIKSGMFLELHEDVGEGDVKRIQKFKGLVIQVKKPNHPDGMFTIRWTIAGVVVEKIFPLSFPKFDKVILLDQFETRRARINYIREKVGKWAKMKSIITVDIKESDLLIEARAAFAQEAAASVEPTPTEEVAVEATPVVETVEEVATPVENTEEVVADAPTTEETTTEETK
jgi:large subunit ribosomal protein L19